MAPTAGAYQASEGTSEKLAPVPGRSATMLLSIWASSARVSAWEGWNRPSSAPLMYLVWAPVLMVKEAGREGALGWPGSGWEGSSWLGSGPKAGGVSEKTA